MTTRGAFLAGTAALVSARIGPGAALAAAPAASHGSPDDLLKRLMEGNKRFVAADMPVDYDIAERREMLVEGQAPFAAVLTCADSRIVPNLVFIQRPGDLFVCRVAGNFASNEMLGSLEYAIAHLGTRLIFVLGHEKCGAVTAVFEAIKNHDPLPPHLDSIETGMRRAIAPVVAAGGSIEAAVTANVRETVTRIASAKPVIFPAVKKRDVLVVGGEYRLGSGRVDLIGK